jgi:hypothetical protein
MLDQFSFSEFEGHLRVATTVDEPEGSVSQLTVLAVDDLHEVGSVGDIGRGEELYAVRMIGPVGYAVTFEQTDPLFTLDLADPADPEVVGELEIPGYSSYLHPVSEDLLLGIGQAGTEDGVLTGTQVSLFDVSDPSSPERIQQHSVDGGSSEAEYDHRAFLWWADTQLAVLPIEVYGSEDPFTGAIGVHVDRNGIDEVGRIEHEGGGCGSAPVPIDDVPTSDVAEVDDVVAEEPPCDFVSTGAPILRSVVVGDALLTVSDGALQSADLDTLEPEAEIAFQG